jgi:hypothetical protein
VSAKIYIFDELEVQEERYAEIKGRYLSAYVPSAKSRGMRLEKVWRSPPVALEGRAATLHILWSVAGTAEWWKMRLGTARANPDLDVPIDGDEEKDRWWRYVDAVVLRRSRTLMVEDASIDADVVD